MHSGPITLPPCPSLHPCRSASAVDTILTALEAAAPDAKRPPRVSKTALARLRVDALRSLVEQLGGDSRGTKDALVGRVLAIAGAEQAAAEQQAAEAAAAARQQAVDGPKEG